MKASASMRDRKLLNRAPETHLSAFHNLSNYDKFLELSLSLLRKISLQYHDPLALHHDMPVHAAPTVDSNAQHLPLTQSHDPLMPPDQVTCLRLQLCSFTNFFLHQNTTAAWIRIDIVLVNISLQSPKQHPL
jgi:hypothetical protein